MRAENACLVKRIARTVVPYGGIFSEGHAYRYYLDQCKLATFELITGNQVQNQLIPFEPVRPCVSARVDYKPGERGLGSSRDLGK